MGTIIEFPAVAASRRPPLSGLGTAVVAEVVILPVVRIERQGENSSGDRGPEEGSAPGRRRRRR